MQALVLGAMIMGLGGSFYAHYVRYISPDAFDPLMGTFLVWVMVIAGGSGNNRGVIVGAVIIWYLWSFSDIVMRLLPPQFNTRASDLRVIFIGLVLQLFCSNARRGCCLSSQGASSSLRGRKRMTGQSLYYPRVMMRTLAQVLTEEYSEHGVHVANIVIDGLIDSPGTRALPRAQQQPDVVMNPMSIAEAFYYLHTQDKSCWTHELQLTPFATRPSF